MSKQASALGGAQFVTMGIGREVFAVPVEAVLEIFDSRPIFHVPEAPAYMLGLIDVRGRSVPVVDLRLKLGLPSVAVTENTRILVLDTVVGERRVVLGLVVDRVFEVAGLDDGRLEPPPEIGTRWRSDYIRGVGRRGDSFVIVFDLARLFSTAEFALIGQPDTAPAGQAA